MTNLDSILKSRDIILPTKVCVVKAMIFYMCGSWMGVRVGLYKEIWAQEKSCFWTVVLGEILESPLDCKEIQPVHPRGNQSWRFIGRIDAEAEASILWLPDAKNWLTGKDTDAGKDWRQEKKRVTEDKMVEWHHWLNGHEFEQTPRHRDRQGSLAYCSPWSHKELDTTELLNWTESMAPPIRTRPSFPLSQSLPSGSFHKPLIFLHQRADRLKITITEN